MSKQPFAVFDIDGTLIRWQLYHATFDALANKTLASEKTYQQIRKARLLWKQRTHSESYTDYELSLVKAYGDLLKTLTIKQYEEAIDSVFEEYKDQVYTFTRDLTKSLKQQGYLLFAISGSPTEVVERMAQYYGFDAFVGATFERHEDSFTGRELSTIHNKGEILKNMVTKNNTSFTDSIGIGDGFNDRAVLELVDSPIAFNPEKRLLKIAREHSWEIVIERKNVIYRLEPSNGQYYLQ